MKKLLKLILFRNLSLPFLLSVAALLLSDFIFPQPFPSKLVFEKLSIEDGLSSTAVYAIYQDKTGFLWFGTENGLNKYDGYNFKTFKHNPDDENSISDDFIWDICEDDIGNLWFATNNGLNKYNPVTGKFTHYLYSPDDSNSISSNIVSSVALDAENNIWIGTWDAGFNIYYPGGNKFKRLHSGNSQLKSDIIWCIFGDSKNNMWIASEGGGLLRYNYAEKNFSQFLEGEIITSVCEDKEGNIWCGSYSNGLKKYNYITGSFTEYKSDPENQNTISDNQVWKVYCDSDGIIWITGVSKGLTYFDKTKNKFTRLNHNPYDPQSISSDILLDIYEDRSKNLWVGTVDKGLNKADRKPQKFFHLKSELNNRNSLKGDFIFSLCEDSKGEIWISNFNDGITKYNPAQNRFSFYEAGSSENSISNNHVRVIYEDKSGDIWIGNLAGGFHKYNRQNNSFKRYNIKNGLSNPNVRFFFEDKENNFWIGTLGGGLNKFDRKTNKFIHYMHNPENKNSLSNNSVTSIVQGKNGFLWIGTYDGGLNKYNPSTNTFKKYLYSKDDSSSISGNIITYLYYSRDSKLWVGTLNAGINLYDENNDSFIRFREKDGLLNNSVCGIGEDSKGNLWISTVKGISRFNYEEKKFTNYTFNDGLQKGELNPGAFFINKDGWIFIAGTNGVNVFHPDSLNRTTSSSPVVITSIKIFNREYPDETQIPFIKEMELEHNQNMISFEFASLDFTNPSRNHFEYILEGFDENWIASGTRNFITYTNLDPGEYIFKVRGTNSDRIFIAPAASVQLIINPPWWKTGWAYTLYILFIAAGLLAIRKFEKNRLKLRNELKFHEYEAKKHREIESMKSRFFANLSHEFRTPLMLIKGPVEKLLKENDNEKISEQLKMIYRSSKNLQVLIDQLLELAQLEASSIPLKAKEENLVLLLRGLTSSFYSLAEERNISLQFDSHKEKIKAWIDRDKLEKIINNLLSNAFKFTNDGGSIFIRVESKEENFVNVIVEDSGKGIPEDKLDKIFDRFFQADDSMTGGSGIGLALVKELVELHKWEIRVSSKINAGTKFILKIPLGDYLNENEKIKKQVDDTEKIPEENFELTGIQHIQTNENEIKEDKPSILIVEDSKDVRIYLSGLLKPDYSIIEASNGKEGIQAASDKSPDLIISDIMMPEMDGIEFCRKIKTEFQTSHIPVILLTAKVSDQSKYEGLETGADDYLTKPFDSKELFIRIKNLLLQRRKLREKFAKEIRITTDAVTTTSIDNEFLNKAFSVAEKNLSDPDFDSESFAKEMFVSRSQLHRKLVAITGQAPGEFLRTFRLKKAALMIIEKKFSITQIAYEVGFNSPSHFTKAFRQHFNCLPSEFSEKVIS